MTIRTPKGESLSQVFYAEKERFAWLGKLKRNVSQKLNRLGDIANLAPSSLNPRNPGNIALYYSGTPEDKARIEKVLKAKFDEKDEAMVQFSRISLVVKLLVQRRHRKAA